MGVSIEQNGSDVTIYGKGIDALCEPDSLLDVGNSGTTIRLMLGILAGRPFHSTVAGDESIAKRPMKRVTEPLKQMGAAIDGRADGGFTPLSVRGGQLKGIDYVSLLQARRSNLPCCLPDCRLKGRRPSLSPINQETIRNGC